MSAFCVLDASALLAFVFGEPGAAVVERHLPAAMIGAVNLCEALTHTTTSGAPGDGGWDRIAALQLEIVPFDQLLAREAAALTPATAPLGLSLGDRACLVLARQRRLPVLTADRAWAQLRIGVDVRLIR